MKTYLVFHESKMYQPTISKATAHNPREAAETISEDDLEHGDVIHVAEATKVAAFLVQAPREAPHLEPRP